MAANTTRSFGPENFITNGLGIPAHDFIENTYDANDNLITAIYKLGGSGGAIVGHIAMTYDANNNLLTVDRVV